MQLQAVNWHVKCVKKVTRFSDALRTRLRQSTAELNYFETTVYALTVYVLVVTLQESVMILIDVMCVVKSITQRFIVAIPMGNLQAEMHKHQWLSRLLLRLTLLVTSH